MMRIDRAAWMRDGGEMYTRAVLSLVITAAGCGVETELEREHAPLVQPDERHYTGADLPAGTISLTYDDGPGDNTLAIAEYLYHEGIQATFFVNGCRFEGAAPSTLGACAHDRLSPYFTYHDPEVLAAIVGYGHRIANHTQDHEGLLSHLADAIDQLAPLQALIDPYIGDDLYLVRSAGGNWGPPVADVINAHPELRKLIGQIHWNISGSESDWACLRSNSPEYCAERYLDQLPADGSGRGIVLLHDREGAVYTGSDPDRRAATLRLTQYLVPRLKARRYRFVPLDAVPNVLSARRFADTRVRRWTAEFRDTQGWDDHVSYYGSIRLADVDGDGVDDLCGRGNTGVRCALSLGAVAGRFFDASTVWTSSFSDTPQGYRHEQYGATLMFGDLDGDGDDDVCVRGNTGVRCARSQGKQGYERFGAEKVWTAPGDFSDASGWDAAGSRYGSIRLAHINHDNRADLCGRSDRGVVCAENIGGKFAAARLWKSDDFSDGHGYAPDHHGRTMQLGDLDGDGLADVCFRAAWGMRCARNVGGGFGPSEEWTHGPFSNLDGWNATDKALSIRFADMNGDGDADVCGRTATGAVCAFADGDRFRTYQYLMNTDLLDTGGWTQPRYGTTVQFGDINGDGVGDVCGRRAGGIFCAVGTAQLADAP